MTNEFAVQGGELTQPIFDATCPGLVAQFDPVSLGHSIERAPVDAEDIRRPRPIASDRLKHVLDVAALHLLERREIFEEAGGDIATGALQQGREIVGSDNRARAEQDDAFDGVLKLPNVAWPVVRQQHVEGAGRQLDSVGRCASTPPSEMRRRGAGCRRAVPGVPADG